MAEMFRKQRENGRPDRWLKGKSINTGKGRPVFSLIVTAYTLVN